jgi:DNA-binding NarL/FixJ family response regulator
MKHIELILADRSPVVLSGFIRFLHENRDIEIVKEVSSPKDLQSAIDGHPGCVAIVDWQMLSLEEITQVAGKSKLILSAMPEDIAERRQALRAGARGFLGRYESAAGIQKAIMAVASGHLCIGNTTAEAILNDELANVRARSVDSERVNQLTARERQVIQAVCEGLNGGGIADRLCISRSTVAHHLTSIFSKLCIKDRSSLIIYAYKHALNVSDLVNLSTAPSVTSINSPKRHERFPHVEDAESEGVGALLYQQALWQQGA